ncbi:hypothetical protein ASPBRDRAFT_74006 [Aspergillus brasiliensis CBS 101740]|uniref:Uncharacterized protein n=1 Tax=Aspergillus brasiliensis (strain CBS 101740 / IMI 381727 / IBT 21946) TaxID=767769 RepID=A0A1L9UPR8_ASPBC|nr:hypothetical protein ASPBRDRAFT_74006 [Aspergillus brasiliensis CBS 101740]
MVAVQMSSTSGLHVAIYHNDGGVYKHWSLFLDGPTKLDKTLNSDARDSADLLELVHLCDVETSDINAIKDAAKMTIHNETPSYICQDYVLETLDDLVERGIIDAYNAECRKNRMILERKQEGLH